LKNWVETTNVCYKKIYIVPVEVGRTGRNVFKIEESIGSKDMKSIFSVPQN
jgi:hypothetical protein